MLRKKVPRSKKRKSQKGKGSIDVKKFHREKRKGRGERLSFLIAEGRGEEGD